MDVSNNPYSLQNNNFPVPSGGQNPNRAPGQGHWAAHQPYTATPAGSTHGFGVNDYDNVIYTSNTLWSNDPAFYGLADTRRPPYNNEFGSHLSYYVLSHNQNEESLGNRLRDHVNKISAGLEEDDVQDVENTAEIMAANVEYEMWKKECEAAKKKKENEQKDKTGAASKKRKGKGSKSGVNRHEKGGLDEEISQLDAKHIQNADIDPDKKTGSASCT